MDTDRLVEGIYGLATYNTVVDALKDYNRDKATLLALKIADMTKK